MDPLSITAGTIAVIGAVGQTAKALQALRAIRQAPTEIQSLLEEVVDLDTLLEQIQADTKHRPLRPEPSASHDGQNGLDRQVRRASEKLTELTTLLESHSKSQKIAGIERRHFAWRRGRRTASVIREDLKLIRMNITASLGALSVSTAERNQSTVERVEKKYDETIKLLATSIRHLAVAPPSYDTPFEITVKQDSSSYSFEAPVESSDRHFSAAYRSHNKLARMTRHPKVISKSDPASLLQFYAKKPQAGCKAWCSCSCHKTSSLRIKKPNNLAIGSLTLTVSGLPWITASCDQKACATRSSPTVKLTVQFPTWLWNGYVASSLICAPLGGPEFSLSLPRTIGWSSKLWSYATQGNVEAIQSLFSQGLASPRDIQSIGGSALHYAADHKHWELCKLLTEQGALQDLEDDFNKTPAVLAWDHILSGALSEDTACQVASFFSKTDFLETRQFTVLHKVVLKLISKDLQTELECSTKELDARDSSGYTCVSWAAKRGDIEALRILLDYGADPNIPDIHGNTPLHHVRDLECCNMLLRHKADPMVVNNHGHTILHSICRHEGQLPLLRRFIEVGVDINLHDRGGETATMNAVWNGHHNCARYLIQKGADLEVANSGGDRAIHLAVIVSSHHCLELLLEQGVCTDCPNFSGQTILHFAAKLTDLKTIEVFRQFNLDAIDVDMLDNERKSARNYLEEREADEQDPDFRKHFEELLSTIAPQGQVKKKAVSIVDQMMALDMAKETVVSCYTPLTTDDEDDEFDDMTGGDEDGHGPVLFYDAVEEVPRMDEIVI